MENNEKLQRLEDMFRRANSLGIKDWVAARYFTGGKESVESLKNVENWSIGELEKQGKEVTIEALEKIMEEENMNIDEVNELVNNENIDIFHYAMDIYKQESIKESEESLENKEKHTTSDNEESHSDQKNLEKIKDLIMKAINEEIDPIAATEYFLLGERKDEIVADGNKLRSIMLKNGITNAEFNELVKKENFDVRAYARALYEKQQEEGKKSNEQNQEKPKTNEQGANSKPHMSEKAIKLKTKVGKLVGKIENEKSPIKRHLLAIKINMLIKRIQREIDLQKKKDGYEERRKSLKDDTKETQAKEQDDVALYASKISRIKNEIAANSEYDYTSPTFIYPKDYIRSKGGMKSFVQELKNSDKRETQEVAAKIEYIASKKKELRELKAELEKVQNNLSGSQKDYYEKMAQIDSEEKSLIVKERMNIFKKIGGLFLAVKQQAKAFFVERKSKKSDVDKARESYKKAKQDIDRLAHKKMVDELKSNIDFSMIEKQNEKSQNVVSRKDEGKIQ